MPDEEIKLLGDYIRQSLGLCFNNSRHRVFEQRLWKRLQELNFDRYMDYYRYLMVSDANGKELEVITRLLTNNETYFFREREDIELFFRACLPELKSKRSSKRIRVLSLGCSTGEEPYTLSMLRILSGYLPPPWELEIHAVDIDGEVLGRAVAGSYGKHSMRECPPEWLERFFRMNGNGKWQISEHLRKSVTFHHFNILKLGLDIFDKPFDAVFCRNVIIYFDPTNVLRAVAIMNELLADDGFLFIGHSESLLSITDVFKPRRLEDRIIYVKNQAKTY